MATSWNAYPKRVLVWVIQDLQLPIAASPSRQDKSTLVEALERYERTTTDQRRANLNVALARASAEYAKKH